MRLKQLALMVMAGLLMLGCLTGCDIGQASEVVDNVTGLAMEQITEAQALMAQVLDLIQNSGL